MRAHVLVPFDGSECAERGLEWAIGQYPNTTITALSVVDPLSEVGRGLSDAPLDTEAGNSVCVGDGVSEMIDQCARDWKANIRTETVVGTPAAAIVEYANEREFDAIIMGTRGRSGVARLLFGSVAETVARHAFAPVMLVK